jgi:hypothetical protein
MRLARGLTLALALLGPASTAQAAAVGLADQAVHHADRGQYGTAVRRFVALFPQVPT